MDAQLFIQKVAAGEAGEAKDTLTDMLSSKAFEALDARKQEIARTIYGEDLDVEVQDTADSEVEDEELLTQEEFESLSEEDQELYLEALEQLDEISLKTATKAYQKRAQKAYDTEDDKEINKQSAQSGRMIKKFGKQGYKAVDSVHRQYDNYKEEVEELDELSKSTLGSYVKKRVKQLPKIEVGYQMAPSDRDARMVKKYQSKVNKGIGRAVDRLAK